MVPVQAIPARVAGAHCCDLADMRKPCQGGSPETTNNQMELMAAIRALDELTEPCEVHLHTDSQYVRGGIIQWMHNWKKNGWKTAAKKPVKNVELWQQLDEARQRHDVHWHWVKGHAGHPENEKADELARLGMEPFKRVANGSDKQQNL